MIEHAGDPEADVILETDGVQLVRLVVRAVEPARAHQQHDGGQNGMIDHVRSRSSLRDRRIKS